jgi:hypothetical protein
MAYSTEVSMKVQNSAGGRIEPYFAAISRGLFTCSGPVERLVASSPGQCDYGVSLYSLQTR